MYNIISKFKDLFKSEPIVRKIKIVESKTIKEDEKKEKPFSRKMSKPKKQVKLTDYIIQNSFHRKSNKKYINNDTFTKYFSKNIKYDNKS
jgi:hypothetical protein